jgi:hypothetical protein
MSTDNILMWIGPPDWGLGMVQTTDPKNKLVTKCHKGRRNCTDSSDKRSDLAQDRDQCRDLLNAFEHGNELSGSLKCWEILE